MLNVLQRKSREYEHLEEVNDVLAVLKSQFANKKLFIKDYLPKTELKINEYLDDGTVMCVADTEYEPTGKILIYGLSDKYLEVELEVLEGRGPGYYHCKISNAKRATVGRKDIRFKVNPNEVYATNFRLSKQSIDLTSYKIPTSIKVVLDQFQGGNSKMSDIVKVDVFTPETKDAILSEIKKHGKTLFIEDTSKEESYSPLTEDFVDLKVIYGKNLKVFMNKNIERGYKSIVIVPIIYITEVETSIPFAYIQLISKSSIMNLDKVLEMKDHAFKLVDRIRDANTMKITVHQQIEDVSRGGVKLRVSDDTLKMHVLKSKGFIFDIVFKLQAPITIFGEIRSSYKDDDGNIFIGIDFAGNSSRKDEMKRFAGILNPMELSYKEKLLKSIKTREQFQKKV